MTQDDDLPRSDWHRFALMSRDDETYTDRWGTILDEENFERLDREVMVSGTYENRPDEGPFDGAKYYAKDINTVFVWQSSRSEWTPLNTGTADRPRPGTTHLERLKTGSLNDILYVDGTQYSDLRSAIAALPDEGGTIVVSDHRETISEPITIETPDTRIYAVDAVVEADSGRYPIIQIKEPNVVIDGLELDGGGDRENNTYADAPNGIQAGQDLGPDTDGYSFVVQDCDIHHCHYATTANRVKTGLFFDNTIHHSRYAGNTNEAPVHYFANYSYRIGYNDYKLKQAPHGVIAFNRMERPQRANGNVSHVVADATDTHEYADVRIVENHSSLAKHRTA